MTDRIWMEQMIARMRSMEGDDAEHNHFEADRMLCVAVQRLAGKQGERLVAAFKALEKWYA